MPDRSRLQVKTVVDPETWVDVGSGDVGENIPVKVEESVLPSGAATSAKQLPDNHQVAVSNFPTTQTVNGTVTVANPTANPETGLAKSVKQDSQITLETTLNSLTETLQELIQRLAPLAGAMTPTAQLRVAQISVPSTAVTGPITSAQSIAEKNLAGVMYTARLAAENLTAIQSNINNCTGV